MEPAPIPPHERSWRHPSELAAQAAPPADEPPTSNRILLVASGAVATALVAVLVVTILPSRSEAPVAVSATTMPPFTLAPATIEPAVEPIVRSAPDTGGADTAPVGFGPVTVSNAITRDAGLALTGAPRDVAAPPGASTGEREIVHVVTDSHVYHVGLDDLDRVVAPDGTVVIADDGSLLGSFLDGRFVAD